MAIPRKSRTSPSPAPASGSTGVTNSTSSPSQASAPGWMVAVAPWVFWGSLVILIALAMRWVPFNWGWMVFFAILGGGASLYIKKNKLVGFFRWIATGILIVTMLSAWFAPNLPQAVESYQPGVPSPQEQVAPPSPTPSPIPPFNPEWRRETLPSSSKAIVLEKSGTITLPKGKKRLFLSHMGDQDGDLSYVVMVGGEPYSAKGAGDFLLPEALEGQVVVDLGRWGQPTYPGGLSAYQFYKTKKPFIELVE